MIYRAQSAFRPTPHSHPVFMSALRRAPIYQLQLALNLPQAAREASKKRAFGCEPAPQAERGPLEKGRANGLSTFGPASARLAWSQPRTKASARDAQQGEAPKATQSAKKYAVRSGGWVAGPDKDITQVMTERFGHRHGYVGKEYGLGE